MKKEFDVIVLGDAHTCVCVTDAPNDIMQRNGVNAHGNLYFAGSAYHTAACLAQKGFCTALVSPVGEDDFCRALTENIESLGVNTSLLMRDSSYDTAAIAYCLTNESGMVHTLRHPITAKLQSAWSVHLTDAMLQKADHLHAVWDSEHPIFSKETLIDLFTRAKAWGLTTSISGDETLFLQACDHIFADDVQLAHFLQTKEG